MAQYPGKVRHGFTLLELLLVVVVLIVLGLIFFPVFTKDRERSGPVTSGCSSREKLLALAFTQYLQDNDDQWPPGLSSAGSGEPSGMGWAGQVYPYIKSPIQFRCPHEDQDNNDWNKPPHCYVSYGYNVHLAQWRNTAYLQSPDRTVLLFEVSHDTANMTLPADGAAQGATMFSAAGDGTASGLHSVLHGNDPIHYATGDLGGRPGGTASQFDPARHQGRSNYLLADGHVRSFKSEQVSTGLDAPTPAAAQTGANSGTAAGSANPNYAATFSVE